jgi:hypothetical protein
MDWVLGTAIFAILVGLVEVYRKLYHILEEVRELGQISKTLDDILAELRATNT